MSNCRKYLFLFLLIISASLNICDNDLLLGNLQRVTLPALSITALEVTEINKLAITFSHIPHTKAAQGINNYSIKTLDDGMDVVIFSADQDSAIPELITLNTEILITGITYVLTIKNLTSDYAQIVQTEGITSTFDGIAQIEQDTSPPQYLSPENDYEVRSSNVVLNWTSRLGALKYYLEISTDEGFNNQVTGSPFQVLRTEYLFEPDKGLTYYWRVRSDITETGQYSNIGGEYHRFHTFGDTLYVYCAADDLCNEDGIGNKILPLKSITNAINKAGLLGIDTIKVAARDSDKEYFEPPITLIDGISIFGGYTPDYQ